jgi:hypothetical protein
LSADSHLHVASSIFVFHFHELKKYTRAGTADALMVMPGEESPDIFQKRLALMKYEMLLLRGLFAACLMASGLILGSMLFSHPAAVAAPGTAVATVQSACVLPADGLICPQVRS